MGRLISIMLCGLIIASGCRRVSAPDAESKPAGTGGTMDDEASGEGEATDPNGHGDAEGEVDTEIDTGTENAADTATDMEKDPCGDTGTQCVGQPDFTLCNIVSVPDRSYDICVKEKCVSPGCGNVCCNAPGPHFPLADTNQRLCYNETEVSVCPASGDAFDGQDAQYGWDSMNSPTMRFIRDTSTDDQPTVRDTVTGFMWQGCALGFSGDDCGMEGDPITFTWEDAVAACDRLEWGGYDDWRLPDEYELDSIVDLGRSQPSIDVTMFPMVPGAAVQHNFWSSSTDFEVYAWVVSFRYGTTVDVAKKATSYARCVRDGPMENRHLEALSISGDRVVNDSVTGLEWQGCAAGMRGDNCIEGTAIVQNWKDALAYCTDLSWGGHEDWRVPNAKELKTVLDHRYSVPAVDPEIFPATPALFFWSSSSLAGSGANAWYVNFQRGSTVYTDGAVKGGKHHTRCVRGGL